MASTHQTHSIFYGHHYELLLKTQVDTTSEVERSGTGSAGPHERQDLSDGHRVKRFTVYQLRGSLA